MGESVSTGTSLLDLPDELLVRCLFEDKAYCSQASRTCRRLLLIGTSGTASGALGFVAQIGRWPAPLLLLQPKAPTLHKLIIHCPSKTQSCEDPRQAFFSTPAGVEPGTAWLHGITRLIIHNKVGDYNLQLDSLLPSAAVMACPALTHLELVNMRLHIMQGSCPVSLPQLQQLRICLDGGSDLTALQKQLQALPKLQNLACAVWWAPPNPIYYPVKAQPHWAARVPGTATKVLCSQLTSMCFGVDGGGGYMSAKKANTDAVLSNKYPNLCKLEIPGMEPVDDATLEMLLQNAPQLRSIILHAFRLQCSYVSRQCRWEAIQMRELDVRSLSLLPLDTVTSITIEDTPSSMSMVSVRLARTGQGLTEDMRVTATAVAAVQRCGGLQTIGKGFKACIATEIDVQFSETEWFQRSQLFNATASLLHDVYELALSGMHINCDVLSTLSSLPKCSEMRVSGNFTYSEDAWRSLLPLTPCINKWELWCNVTPKTALIMCRAATHPVIVMLSGLSRAFPRRQQAAFASCCNKASNGLVEVIFD